MNKRTFTLLLALSFFVVPQVAFSKQWVASDGTKLVKYDEELYLLSYNTFLANKNLKDALLVARAAVAQNPNNIAWKKRLAEAARWSNHPRLAFGMWYQLAMEEKSTEAIDNALTLAANLNEINAQQKLLQLKIKLFPNDSKSIEQLIKVEELLGKPERAINLLEKYHTQLTNINYLTELARLHKGLGQPDQEVKVIRRMETAGNSDSKLILREVEILYSKGEFEAAVARLRQGASGNENNPEYWITAANLAWHVNDKNMALNAYRKIFHFEKADGQAYTRLIQLLGDSDPAFVYQVSKQAWQKTHDSAYFFSMISSGAALKKWQELNNELRHMPPELRGRMESQPYYWEVRASVADQMGDREQADKDYKSALAQFPNDQSIRLSYAWFLVAHQDVDQLKVLFSHWNRDLTTNPAFTGLYINILQQLGFTLLAIEHTAKQYPKNNRSVVWLNQFAQLLDTMEPQSYSYLLRQRAWRLQKQFPKQNNPELNRAIAELATQLAPAETSLIAIYRTIHTPGFRELLLGWSLSQEAHDLAHLVRDRMPSVKDPVPRWADLTLSLHDYDKDRLHHLLSSKPDELAYRDAVSASEVLQDLPAAEEWAYTNLDKHPHDGLLYEQFVQLMETHANKWLVDADYTKKDGVAGFYPKAYLRYFIKPSTALIVQSDHWNVGASDSPTSADVAIPNKYWKNAVGLLRLVERGFVEVLVGQQQAFNRFYTFSLKSLYRITDRFTLLTHLGWNEKALDTVQLELAGLKDFVSIQGIYRFNRNQHLITELNFNRLRDQDRALLAPSSRAYIAFEQKLRDTYPDLSLRVFASHNQFHPVSQLPQFLRGLSSQPDVNINSFIPHNFYEYGVSVQWGENYRTRYTKPWHPFLVTSVFQNSESGLGYYGVVGVAGKVLGHDHLAVYYERSKGQRGQSQLNELVGVSYSRYF